MPEATVKWALIILGDYKIKFKVKTYTINPTDDIISINSEDGAYYKASMKNVLLMDKEPVFKNKRGN